MTEGRDQRTDDRWQKTEGRRQRADDRGWEIGEFGRRNAEWGSDWKVEIGRIYKGE
jgi:hypothetical protein